VEGVDSPEFTNMILGVHHRASYHARLLKLVKEYLAHLNTSSRLSSDARSLVDKPNAHRLLELYVHTIPAFGHARHIQELIFEHAHQPLKRIWEQHNPHNRHYAMVREILYDDLFHRINSSLSEYRRAQGDDKRKFAIHLSSLLFGRVLNSPPYRSFDAEISAKLDSIVSNPAVCGVLNFRMDWKREGYSSGSSMESTEAL